MTIISAEVVLASTHADEGHTLWTFVLEYPRFIHAEFMTHRVFARNASSSRAIPVERMIRDVENNPAVPLFWGKNQRGMQAGEEHREEVMLGLVKMGREEAWRHSMGYAIFTARAFAEAGYHKQVVNRIIEPYTHIKVVASTTHIANFLALRDHEAAEPHIRVLAQRMREAMAKTTPLLLSPGQWHLPFIRHEDRVRVGDEARVFGWSDEQVLGRLQQLSVARCASVSYKTVDGFEMSSDRAHDICEKLTGTPMHATPFEHVAQADTYDDNYPNNVWRHRQQHGCFTGFRQLRKMMPGEFVHD